MTLVLTTRLCMLAAVLALAGCNKKEASPTPGASASAASEPACTYSHPDPKFCFSPPAGYAAEKPEVPEGMGVTRLRFTRKEPSGSMTIEWRNKPSQTDECENAKMNAAADTKYQDDGAGGCWVDAERERKLFSEVQKYHFIEFLKKGPKGWVKCMSNGPPESDVQAVLAACRGLRFD
jgi:hypothetical protein